MACLSSQLINQQPLLKRKWDLVAIEAAKEDSLINTSVCKEVENNNGKQNNKIVKDNPKKAINNFSITFHSLLHQ